MYDFMDPGMLLENIDKFGKMVKALKYLHTKKSHLHHDIDSDNFCLYICSEEENNKSTHQYHDVVVLFGMLIFLLKSIPNKVQLFKMNFHCKNF